MEPQRLEALAHVHGIELVVQFGSTVSGLTHQRSDLDLGLLLRRAPVSFGERADLRSDLQALMPDREVDLAILNHADPLFLKQVMDQARLLYGSPERFERLRLFAFKRYQDHRRFLQMEREYVDRKIAGFRR